MTLNSRMQRTLTNPLVLPLTVIVAVGLTFLVRVFIRERTDNVRAMGGE